MTVRCTSERRKSVWCRAIWRRISERVRQGVRHRAGRWRRCLSGDLELTAIPRRPDAPEPGRWSHYALALEGDTRLTDWMRRRLKLAAWSHPAPPALGELETAVLEHFAPPLNLNKVAQPWSSQVRRARAGLAAAAARWAREHAHEVDG